MILCTNTKNLSATFGRGSVRQRWTSACWLVKNHCRGCMGVTKTWVRSFRMADYSVLMRNGKGSKRDRWGWHPRWWWGWWVDLGGGQWSGLGPLPWLWGRKWCLKGEVGRESLFLEPTLLLHREEQSFCMPVRASAGWEGVRQGTNTPRIRQQRWTIWGGDIRWEGEGQKKRKICRNQIEKRK